MRSTLCEAVARCHGRRMRQAAAAAPLPAGLAVILVALAPLALVRAGHALGNELAGAVGAGGVANALVLGPLLAGVAAGATLAVSIPGRSALGDQIAAGPGGRIVAVLAGVLVPGLVGVLALLPSLVAVCVALASELPGGGLAGLALSFAIAGALPAGAILAEAGLAAVCGRRRWLPVVAGGVVAWSVIGVVSGAALLGPFAPVGSALRGSGSVWLALLAAGGTAIMLAVAWVPLAAARPTRRARTSTRGWRLVREGRPATPTAIVALLIRRDDVRLATAGTLAFGAAGVGVAVSGGTHAPTPFLLATTTALLGSILCSLAVCGVLVRGRWLWIGGPGDRRGISCAACLVGLAGAALPVAVVGVAATAASGASLSAVGIVTVYVCIGSGAALLAGALVPWTGEGAGDQMTTFAALAVIAIAMCLGIGLVAPRLVAYGLPDAVVGALLCLVSLAIAFRAVDRRLGVSG